MLSFKFLALSRNRTQDTTLRVCPDLKSDRPLGVERAMVFRLHSIVIAFLVTAVVGVSIAYSNL